VPACPGDTVRLHLRRCKRAASIGGTPVRDGRPGRQVQTEQAKGYKGKQNAKIQVSFVLLCALEPPFFGGRGKEISVQP